jgi:putative membrane protein
MYEWVKVAHIVSVISWMVGFLYLPRLMVYHQKSSVGSDTSETFKVMERRLLKAIMTPAMIASWVFGLWLIVLLEAWGDAWFVSKLFLVFILTGFHGMAAKWVKEFSGDQRIRSQKFFRVVNEVPAVIMIFIVVLVVVKPF